MKVEFTFIHETGGKLSFKHRNELIIGDPDPSVGDLTDLHLNGLIASPKNPKGELFLDWLFNEMDKAGFEKLLDDEFATCNNATVVIALVIDDIIVSYDMLNNLTGLHTHPDEVVNNQRRIYDFIQCGKSIDLNLRWYVQQMESYKNYMIQTEQMDKLLLHKM